MNYVPYSGKLTEEQETLLKSELRQNLYICRQDVVDYVEHNFGITYTNEGMVKLLHRLGFVYKKTKAVPCKADPEKQAEFMEEVEKLFKEQPMRRAAIQLQKTLIWLLCVCLELG